MPLAWHITFGTYGTRLHGDPRGTVDRRRSHIGQPFEPYSLQRVGFERGLMVGLPVMLTVAERRFIESSANAICESLEMNLLAVAAAPDHVHAVVTSNRADGVTARRLIKRALSLALDAEFTRGDCPRWWAEGGSAKPVQSPEYLGAAVRYVTDQSTRVLIQRGPGRGRPGSGEDI